MAADYYTILTAQGRAKFAAAVANNTPLNLTAMAVGDSNGTGYAPTEGQTALTHETYRAPLNQLVQDVGNHNWFVAEMVIPDTVGGFTVREVGLYDNTNTLIAIGRFPDSFKPTLPSGSNKQLYIRMVFEVTNATSVTLLVDPSIVMATQTYVQNEIKKAVNALDFKNSVRAVATTNVALTGLQTIDTVSLVAGNRVLLAGQTDTKQNGIYIVAAGAWVRSTDADENYEVTAEMMMAVEEGTVNASTLWQLTSNMPLTIGTSALTFEKTGGVSGAIPGTYRSVTVDKFGRVIAGTNPTTLAGYGVTDGVTQAAIQNQTYLAVTTAGTAPTYTGSVTPAPATLAAGLRVRAKFHASTTAASTLNLNALGAKPIKQMNGAGVLVDAGPSANQLADLEYDGANWIVLDPLPTLPTVFFQSTAVAQSGYTANTLYPTGLTITATRAGRMLVLAKNTFQPRGTAEMCAYVLLNGNAVGSDIRGGANSATAWETPQSFAIVNVVAGDVISSAVQSNGGGVVVGREVTATYI